MQLTYSEASRYSDILEILSSPYALMICDHLFETEEYVSVDDLVKLTKTTNGKVVDICYKLEKKGILDRDNVKGIDMYQVNSSTYSYFVKQLLNLFD